MQTFTRHLYDEYIRRYIIQEVVETAIPEEQVRAAVFGSETIEFRSMIMPKVIYANFMDANIKVLMKIKKKKESEWFI